MAAGRFAGMSRDAIVEPLRGERYGAERLEQLAVELARAHVVGPGPRRGAPLIRRLAENRATLTAVYRATADAARQGRAVSFAAEWILDNFHVVQDQMREAAEDLPPKYYRELPKLEAGELAGLPRVYALAVAFTTHTDGHLDVPVLARFLAAYQSVSPLTIGELWAVPIALRLALIENLGRLAARVDVARQEVEAADKLMDQLVATAASGEAAVRAAIERRVASRTLPSTTMFAAEMLQRLRDQDPALDPAIRWLEARLASQGTNADEAMRVERQTQSANQVSVGNAITSMRTVTATDWAEFFESLGAVDAVLADDPPGVYRRMDFATRDRYRHAVERLARRTRRAEVEVAGLALRFAREASAVPGADPRRAHVGFYLVGEGLARLEAEVGYAPRAGERARRAAMGRPAAVYIGAVAAVTAALVWAAAAYAGSAGGGAAAVAAAALLAAIPASDLAVSLVNTAVTLLLPPRVLPKLDLSEGIPGELKTLVVVPTLFGGEDDVRQAFEYLEVRYLANQDDNLAFAVLSDFTDAPAESMPGDDALVEAAAFETRALNARHGGGRFFLFHRPRRFNAADGTWMGWERKRGKLEELNRFLLGAPSAGPGGGFSVVEGDTSLLSHVPYVITLDSDTSLPADSARRLVGAIAHPLNRARLDERTRTVVEGYGILQPRVSVSLEAFARTRFSRIFSGYRGVDPYTSAVSDVYQDLFGEASYVGKGIYDVAAFARATEARVPDNAVLSHDLFEGLYSRTALVSDVELFDDFPSRYDVYSKRKHRWTRGDWQIAPWLLGRVPAEKGRERNVIRLAGRWRIFDNLRRSLVAPAALALLAAGWAALPGSPLAWTAAVALVVAFPVYAHVAMALLRAPKRTMLPSYFRSVREDVAANAARVLLAFAFLPHQAWLLVDAIARVAWRMLVTRRRMLEWVSAAASERRAGDRTLRSAYAGMRGALAAAAAAAAWVAAARPEALPVATPFLLVWAAAPAVAVWLGRPSAADPAPALSAADARFLRLAARKTWRFFERFVAPEDSWIPPDNFQEFPTPVVAHRTSPTNLGLGLLANVAARDLGYLGVLESTERVELTFASMEGLERFRGHYLNWYDTTTRAALQPRYVSTVDSGNLAGHLVALKQACLEAIDLPILPPAAADGLEDVCALLAEAARRAGAAARAGAGPLRRLEERLAAFGEALRPAPASLGDWATRLDDLDAGAAAVAEAASGVAPGTGGAEDLEFWAAALRAQLRSHRRDLEALAPWVALLARPPEGAPADLGARLDAESLLGGHPSLDELSLRAERLLDAAGSAAPGAGGPEAAWLAGLAAAATEGDRAATECMARLSRLAHRLGRAADEMDFGFLYDRKRKLFSIGFAVDAGRLDESYYDLLASESRLGSFVAVTKGDVPTEHWNRLGRAMTAAGGDVALVSWTGSMFEYLMPDLVMKTFARTLIGRTRRAVVREQVAYGNARGVPWGVSEAAYNARDLQRNYQYGPFGVPSLGLKRGLADSLVVAPYASALALGVDPPAAAANLRRHEADGHSGRFGFYESVDYTPGRVPAGQTREVVRTYMAHHQGMTLLAINEALSGRPMARRFHADPAVRAHEVLLQERDPQYVEPVEPREDDRFEGRSTREALAEVTRYFETTQLSTPRIHLLSNGSYSVMVTTAGGGYSRRGGVAITRWREDVTRDHWGQFCYLRDARSGRVWSSAYQPTLAKPESYAAIYSLDKAEFRRVDDGIETHTTVSVSTEDDAEVRTVALSNLTPKEREVEVTSYAELVLAPHAADVAHPAFSNLFLQTEFLPGPGAILATRRRRSAGEAELWAVHVTGVDGDALGAVQYETDRARFLGRGRTPADPAAVTGDRPLSNTVGAVLDPIVSLRRRVRIPPHGEARVVFTTAFAESRERAAEIAGRYADAGAASRASDLAWTDAHVELRHLGATPEEATVFLRLASRLLFVDPHLRARPDVIARNRRGQSGLWAYGISGDLPVVLVRVSEAEHIPLVRQLLRAHELWRLRGLASDLVILNEHPASYQQELQEALLEAVRASLSAGQLDRPGGVFVRRADLMPEEDRTLLLTVARAVLAGGRGTLAQQIERKPRELALPPALATTRAPGPAAAPAGPPPALELSNGIGGFADGGREYVIVAGDGHGTPAPWTNVVANPRFGFLVTESGGGYTWSENSRENRLTSWSNDPVSDPPSEAVYVRDEATGAFWSPTPLPAPSEGRYVVRHGQGYSVFEHTAYGVETELTVFVPPDDPVKLTRLRIANRSATRRRLAVMSYAELVLGVLREASAPYVVTEVDPATGALLAHNHYNNEFAGRVAFAASSPAPESLTAERKEFLGRNGTLARPNALLRTRLAGQVGAGYDPCAALHVAVELEPGAETEVVFMLGEGADGTEARSLAARYQDPATAAAALEQAKAMWERTLGAVQVQTPDRAFDLLVNRWLLYQTVCCRVWARAAFYQSGGAYGFRDQLQDVAAAVHARPDIAREHLLRAAARQFVEGDVQHWWHPPTGRGVRTRFSDDLLWLPLVAERYAAATGDFAVFDEVVPFIEARPLAPGEDEAYLVPDLSPEHAPLYDHCVRAIERSLAVGAHGVPLMGSGDWNDGMNRVGHGGAGESVWVGWFLAYILRRFAGVADRRGDGERAARYLEHAAAVAAAIEETCWDGEWYLRAFFDDGTPLGSARNEECRIDSIAQSWGVISGAAEPHRAAHAMASVEEYLVRRGDGLIMLFTPPFDRSGLDPGYIKGYVPGVRENGGQYTHAAIWVVLAYAMLGDGDRAGELFALLNPVNHSATRAGVHKYKVEPYVAAADVYAVPPHTGRGGWTWYTGSASWMYRVALESILGFTREGDELVVDPCIPRTWPGFTVTYRHGSATYRVRVENPSGVSRGVVKLELDGAAVGGGRVPLADDGKEHDVLAVLGHVEGAR